MKQVSNRCGLITKKICMSQIFDLDTGCVIPVTILLVPDNIIIDIISDKNTNFLNYKIAAISTNKSKLSKADLGQFKKVFVYKRIIKQFRAKNDTFLEVGDKLDVSRYSIGQYIDVSSFSIGKGFSGCIKKHNFKGLEATHGVSLSHRSLGSTGQCQDPGKVFRGKKMPGHMGNSYVTIQNVKIIDIDKLSKLIIVKGAVPGSTNSIVIIRDSIKKTLVT